MENGTLKRFLAKVHRDGECWRWHGAIQSGGYGHLASEGTQKKAHRLAYEHFVGPIPKGLFLDHLCRNRWCVNPEHVEPVTQRVNNLRGESLQAVNARKTHCAHGHEFSPENTVVRAVGGRTCVMCRRVSTRLAQRRHRLRVRQSKECAPSP